MTIINIAAGVTGGGMLLMSFAYGIRELRGKQDEEIDIWARIAFIVPLLFVSAAIYAAG